MSLLANSNAIESGGYNIDRSLRFRSSASAYLSRSVTASSQTTWTLSLWCKRGQIGTASDPFLYASNDSTGNNWSSIRFASDQLEYFTIVGGAYTGRLLTNAVFRDPSAWYHIVCVIDTNNVTAADRQQLWVNGVRQTSFAASANHGLGNTTWINGSLNHYINANFLLASFGDKYLSEINFVSGQALTPSSFGQTDAVTGVWQPVKYTGTYGTNGFYLNFSDNTSATTLAYDKSGNGNNWAANNISTTAGATYDSMTDVPTLTSATAANYCVLNPLDNVGNSISNGNLYASLSGTGGVYRSTRATFGVSSGKYYWENVANANSGADVMYVGFCTQSASLIVAAAAGTGAGFYMYHPNGSVWANGTQVATYASYTSGDVIAVALDMDSGTASLYKNGTSLGTPFTGLSGTLFPVINLYQYNSSANINFGQRPFSFTPPTGFKALNTFNLPDPTIKKPNQYMDAVTFTGNGTTQTISSLAFQPDFIWGKSRSAASSHRLIDSIRGVTKVLYSDTTDAEGTETTALTSFNSNGYTMGGGSLNPNTVSMVDWIWKESATAGFDIVTYTGNDTNRTVAHNLGVAPSMMIVKDRSSAQSWAVWHKSLPDASYYLLLNSTNAQAQLSTVWNNTAPTSTVFSLGIASAVNLSPDNYVAYLFAEIAGFSKFGSFVGNGSSDGPFVYCGFRPAFVMIKQTSSAGNDWVIRDNKRASSYNEINADLFPNTSTAETSDIYRVTDFTSNGFKIRNTGSGSNSSGSTYIYAAFAENPFKYSNAR